MTTASLRYLRAAGASLLLAAPAFAQKDPAVRIDERWRQFVGCWATQTAGMLGPNACVVGTADPQTVELLTFTNDTVVTRVLVDASGEKVARTRDGCTGWERGTWSGDERRLFVQSELTCGGGPLQKSTVIYATTQNGAFSRIEGVKTRGATGVRVINFRAILPSAGIASSIIDRMPAATDLRSYAARVEAAAPLSSADVVEALKATDARVVEAWLADRGQAFSLAATDLRALRDAGVTPDVIDMMVAVSNPRVFSLAPGGVGGQGTPQVAQGPRGSAGGAPVYFDPTLGDPYLGSNPYGYNGSYYGGYGAGWAYGRNAYSNLFNPYASCVGALSCGYGTGWAYGGGPYVIITQPAGTPAPPPGRVVNGSGYSQGGSSGGGRTATPTYDGGGRATTSVGSSGGGSSSGGSAPAASTGGGEQRTAKPRP